MSAILYDEAIVNRLQELVGPEAAIQILKPDETARLFGEKADESRDALSLPLIALSRRGFRILNAQKQPKSYDGIKLLAYDDKGNLVNEGKVFKLNAIPIQLEYQLDIYTVDLQQSEEYSREFIFELVNNPTGVVELPYNNTKITHKFSIHVEQDVVDNSDIPERVFPGQFTRYTLKLNVDDAYLFSVPVKKNVEIACAGVVVEDRQSHKEIEKIKVFSKDKK